MVKFNDDFEIQDMMPRPPRPTKPKPRYHESVLIEIWDPNTTDGSRLVILNQPLHPKSKGVPHHGTRFSPSTQP